MSSNEPTPQERLAISRRAIVRHMTRDHKGNRESRIGHGSGSNEADQGFGDFDEPQERSTGFLSVVRNAVRSWWHYHPANVALDVARPMIGRYAQQQPFKLLAISAGIGAAAVVLRPWRLVSLGGIALAAVKSSGLSNLVLSMISNPLGHSTQNTGNTP